MIRQGFVLFLFIAGSAALWCETNNNDLKMLHVLFRHGDRTPEEYDYPNNPYRNAKFARGFGELTAKGEKRCLDVGKMLHCRYQQLLEHRHYYDMLSTLSSEYNRTRESLMGIAAGMFPPDQNERLSSTLKWQPIPTNYLKFKDDEMIAVYKSCRKIFQLPDIADSLDPEMRKALLEIRTKAGFSKDTNVNMIVLRDNLVVMNEMGYDIPEWARPYWPEPMSKLTTMVWHQLYEQRLNLIVGNLLNKIAKDSTQALSETDKRVYLYGVHDINIGAFLTALEAFGDQKINYASYVAFEITEVDGQRFVMVYHDNHDEDTPTYLDIPGCGFKCPVEDFVVFAEKFRPTGPWCA